MMNTPRSLSNKVQYRLDSTRLITTMLIREYILNENIQKDRCIIKIKNTLLLMLDARDNTTPPTIYKMYLTFV